MDAFSDLAEKIISQYKHHISSSAFTIAISGIDASGKGYIGNLLQQELEESGYKVANINIDPWQNPMPVRLKKENAAENFYNNVFRWDGFFDQLILPLQQNRSIHLVTKGIHTHADEYYTLVYDFNDIDILLIEGIFLFRKEFVSYYAYKIWIDCSFETAMQRAIKRNAEKLDEEKLIKEYTIFYYAAQKIHITVDNPIAVADVIFDNNMQP